MSREFKVVFNSFSVGSKVLDVTVNSGVATGWVYNLENGIREDMETRRVFALAFEWLTRR